MRRVGELPIAPPQPDGPCRFCGVDAYGCDETGPVHRCCAKVEAAGETSCYACRESRIATTRRDTRIATGRQGRWIS